MKDTEVSKYLQRINLDEVQPTLDGLIKLQAYHMENIPFENLDVAVGRKISLDIPHLFKKLILKKRGGYCFELNTLYAELLRSLGFAPKPVLGRVWLSNPKNMPPRTHLAHLVELDEKTYITDVGFGGLITRIPLNIHVFTPVNDADGKVRLLQLSDNEMMIQRYNEEEWTNQYSFENIPISLEDIEVSNHYMSTHPDSHFYAHKFVGKYTKEGRIGLFNNKMSIRKGIKVVDKKRIDFGKDWLKTIKEEFSLELDFSDKELNILFEKNQKNS